MSSDKIELTQKEFEELYIITDGEHNRGISDESKAPLEEVTTPKDEVEITIEEEDTKLKEEFYNA